VGIIELSLALNSRFSDKKEIQQRAYNVLREVFPSWILNIYCTLFSRPFPEFSACMNAFVAKWASVWLVGECEIIDIDLENPTTTAFIENNRHTNKNVQSIKSNCQSSNKQNHIVHEIKAEAAKLITTKKISSSVQPATTSSEQKQTPKKAVGKNQGLLVKRCRFLEESSCASACVNSCKIPTQNFFIQDMNLPVTMTPNYETYECIFEFGKLPTTENLSDSMDTPCLSRCPSYGKLRSLHNKGGASMEKINSISSSKISISLYNNKNKKQKGENEQQLSSRCHSMDNDN